MEITIEQALSKAVEAHTAGQIQEADRLYTLIIKVQPQHPHANHNLGVLAVGIGKVKEALPFLKTALESNPNIAQFWISYIDALMRLDRNLDAKAVFDQAKSQGAKGDGFNKLEQRLSGLSGGSNDNSTKVQDPPQDQLQSLIKLYNKGQLQKALKQADAMFQTFPESAVLFNIRGAILKGLGELASSVDAYKQALAIKPDYADAYNNMGTSLQEQSKAEEAIEAYKHALAIKPDYAEAHYNMGVTLQKQGKLEEAIEAYKQALSIKPDYVEAQNNMGNALQKQGKLEEAIKAYKEALSIKPDYAEAYYNTGNCLIEKAKLEEAIEAYTKALAIKPNYNEVHNNMGNALKEKGDLKEAIEAYKKAIAIKPDDATAWLNGADAWERSNKLNELGLWLERAFQILKPVPPDISFMKAKLLWRNKDTQEASKIISNIDVKTIKPSRQQDFFHLKAKCYEASKDFNLAFFCFENMNSLAKKSNDYLRLNSETYFQSVRGNLEILNSKKFKKPANDIIKKTELVPVFLVGFPRSGTTLLDTILRSHSRIDVVEEQPLVSSAKAFVEKSGYSEIGQALPEEIISGARKAYINELNKHRKSTGSKSILIDKLPLNLLHIPLIQQLYPQAKFILALRHPLDTILSCWMQNFKLNEAMANMVDLDRIVEFYCVAMETFQICRHKYNLSVHQIKYEDLVEDLNKETSALLKFLDLDWEDQMENYHKTAIERGRINTPSYSQVVQPIYKDAKYRWLNYEEQLVQYFKQVEGWINVFGYDKR